ncbi:hypothetical protein M408DRAFT_325468 [Serendipita vermifera MAFF 305830]|uniref:Copper acquisition factor BIM1-like domain-containing protein n=1 Tax=Serendipita vermifera MAFF 305830 TaxID=933852 RepID=A0A0C3BR11_SERVB|nr:hypothetical protein M408DRAFT_325468 [Serendipita vermifera MAFF 305830]
MLLTRLSALLALAGAATAHFTLDYPPSRAFNEDDEVNAPCGGAAASTTRTPFPLGDGFIRLTSTHEPFNILVLISFVDNPTDIKNFTFTPSGEAQAPVRDFFQVTMDDVCIGVDIGAIGYANATDGARATIAIQYQGGDSNLYQCADVILASNATIPSNITCNNEYTVTTAGASPTGSPSGSSSPSASATSSRNGAEQMTVGLGFGGVLLALLGAALF